MFPLAGAIAMGGMSLIGQMMANNQSEANASNATSANMREAQNNRNFQAQMSNTAHQREMADLKAAGLNPLLTATGGAGASSPGGSTGQAVVPEYRDPISPALSSAAQAVQISQQAQMQDQQIKSMGLDNEKKAEEMKLIREQTKKTGVESETAKKSLPETELKNEAYQWLKKNVNEMLRSSSKHKENSERIRNQWENHLRKQNQLNYLKP